MADYSRDKSPDGADEEEDGDDAKSDDAKGDDAQAEAFASSQGLRQMEDMFCVPKSDGSGGWVFSGSAAEKEVAKLLEWRKEALNALGWFPGLGNTILPLEQQKELQRRHFEEWRADNPETVDEVSRRHGFVKHKIHRDLLSYHRTTCLRLCGGREWLYLLIALGEFNDDILECMNEAAKERKDRNRKEKVDSGKWKSDETIAAARAARASAPARGAVIGVKHTKSRPKLLRERARKLEKDLIAQRRRTQTRLNIYKYQQLKREVDRAWFVADQASQAAGVEYAGRGGVRKLVPEVDNTLVGRALALYSARQARA